MSNRIPLYMTLAVIACILAIVGMNLYATFNQALRPRFLSPNDVRGSALAYKGKIFTLNFEQQNALLALINKAMPEKNAKKGDPIAFEKLIFYRFQAPDLTVKPIGITNNKLGFIFSSPELNGGSPLIAEGTDNLEIFFSRTYDH